MNQIELDLEEKKKEIEKLQKEIHFYIKNEKKYKGDIIYLQNNQQLK